MAYGVSKRDNVRNDKAHRAFCMCDKKVSEKLGYAHAGDEACLFNDVVSHIEERLSKARQALDDVIGVRFMKIGVTIGVCNTIFWNITAPISPKALRCWLCPASNNKC